MTGCWIIDALIGTTVLDMAVTAVFVGAVLILFGLAWVAALLPHPGCRREGKEREEGTGKATRDRRAGFVLQHGTTAETAAPNRRASDRVSGSRLGQDL